MLIPFYKISLRVCLQSARCSIELEFITGLHQLSLLQPDITFVPSLVRESDDRVEFLQEVLLSNPNLYTSYDSILDITRKLVASKNIDKSLNRVKALLIETALKSDDTVVSWILCKEFLGAKKRKSQKQEGGGLWKLLVAISENSKFTDLDKKLQLLSQAVAICPTQEISYVLQLLKRADAEKAISSSGISQQGPAISSASSILKQQQHSSTSTTTRERIKSLIFGFDAVSLQYRGVSLENMVKDVMSLVVVDSGSKSSGSLLADLYSCDEFFFEKLSLDNGHNSTTNIKRNNIELDIFDTLHRVKSSNGGGDSCSPNSISTFDDEYEQHMLNISREFIDSDSPISAGYLLHISKVCI